MGRHVKKNEVKVTLNDSDAAALRTLVRLEVNLRKDPELGAATLLREYAMPRVHERLAELRPTLEAQTASS